MKSLPKILLTVYLLILLWLVLFKLSYDIGSVLLDHQTRSLNLIPFADASRGEMISNFIAFIPSGLLLCVALKRLAAWHSALLIFGFSISVEAIQYLLAIGMTDITDVIMNTLGGLFGLAIYRLASKRADNVKLDKFILVIGVILLALLILMRVFVFRVKY